MPNINAETPLERILTFLNARFLAVTLPEDFASLIFVRYRPNKATIDYASAGHETAYLISRTGECGELPCTGPLLGVTQDAHWTTRTLSINGPPETDHLFLYTDGATDSLDNEGHTFGRNRLRALLNEGANLPLDKALAVVSEALRHHRGGTKSDRRCDARRRRLHARLGEGETARGCCTENRRQTMMRMFMFSIATTVMIVAGLRR